jgi:hypothetical protein
VRSIAAGLFTEAGGEAVAFRVEEGAYRFLAASFKAISKIKLGCNATSSRYPLAISIGMPIILFRGPSKIT